ncbi:guanylyl cyclase 1 isoform X1 [Tripterygium wilfordii]|uniref:guanylyl cyclase 1 isoform X1 n=2 Tax=Tripterygium wilfordii TaxID=458696 RepID=UPI0018F80F62|nr:guanylyl cyclase 1 isoform X1 [Tripterygium wilfordii]XP_038721139.1 guanylyl cyclase 1 isoform X1 [Tripterygium wilfordii]XP_038721140.1 guanylyl cyclase 1 isoform X1 [Tripterygium wilfordii]
MLTSHDSLLQLQHPQSNKRLNLPFFVTYNRPIKSSFSFSSKDEEINEAVGDESSLAECYPSELPSNDAQCNDAVLTYSHYVEVPHINQQFSWDCGLACVLMVLSTIGINDFSIQSLAELCRTTSIWTVDLAYLLQKFSVRFSYFTVTFGANPDFSVETFYKEQLPNDLVRVDMLFQKAREAEINIQCRSISGEEISILILSGKYIAIVLVDQFKLSQSWLENVIVSGFNSTGSGYTGHYVVICGYDAAADEFEIRDPASSWKHERVSAKRLDEARRSFGTDEDLLLICIERNEPQSSSSLTTSPDRNMVS